MEYVFFYLGLCAVVGVVAQQRRNRNGVGWFLLSFLISPLIAGLLVLAMQSRITNAPYRVEGGRIVSRSSFDAEFAETERQIELSRGR